MQLNILAYGDVGIAAAIFFGDGGDQASLSAGENAVGDANANHEICGGFSFAVGAADDPDAIALGVDAPGAKVSAGPLGWNGVASCFSELANFVKMLPGVFFFFETLDALHFGFFSNSH